MDLNLILKDHIIPIVIFHMVKNIEVYEEMDKSFNKDKEYAEGS